MTAGLGIDRLLDFFFDVLYLFQFWRVVEPYQQALITTFGLVLRRKPVKGPGLRLIWPLSIERVIIDNVVPADLGGDKIDMTLKDGTQLHVSISGRWRIIDMMKFHLENEDTDTILENVAGMVQEYLFQYTWQELIDQGMRGRGGLTSKLKTYCNQELRDWGAELDRLYIYSFIRMSLKDGVIKVL
jgi:regulator of protease activity HflC (stomatin/prohibitin superfamily)